MTENSGPVLSITSAGDGYDFRRRGRACHCLVAAASPHFHQPVRFAAADKQCNKPAAPSNSSDHSDETVHPPISRFPRRERFPLQKQSRPPHSRAADGRMEGRAIPLQRQVFLGGSIDFPGATTHAGNRSRPKKSRDWSMFRPQPSLITTAALTENSGPVLSITSAGDGYDFRRRGRACHCLVAAASPHFHQPVRFAAADKQCHKPAAPSNSSDLSDETVHPPISRFPRRERSPHAVHSFGGSLSSNGFKCNGLWNGALNGFA